ncbi:MAG: hypothetical protein HW408_1369 [Actinobacteria bacterium]|nr:hypothetical protein [Actinomycetota bacterium]
MALFNYATRELSAKIVYYGPGLSGKTTNIDMVHRFLRPDQKGRLISLPTETDRTLFFDFLPLDLGQIKGFKVRFHLYTVPGQVFYNATRRLVLQGVDGVVFVADSQVEMAESNHESLKNLVENLAGYGKKLDELPFVIQYNKRDLRQVSTVKELNARLNPMNVPAIEGIAKDGVGVSETLVTISRMVFDHLRKTLLLPGEKVEHEGKGGLAEAMIAKPPPPKAEPLEEISEIEEIQEIKEEGKGPDILQREPEAFVEETTDSKEKPGSWEVEGILDIPDVKDATILHEVAPGEGETVSPEADGSVPEDIEILPGAPPIVEEDLEIRLEPVPDQEEIEIEIPERISDPSLSKTIKAGISVESDCGELTFLKFEPPIISQEGHAVLPAVFMDDAGNMVRLRIRISMEERR